MHQLFRKLSKPSKVASVLDWKKLHGSTVLSLNIHRDRVGIAVASHPAYEQPCIELEPLRFTERNQVSIDAECLDRFSDIIDEYKVCGVVVSWPLQHDSGKMGAACGRVIFALEQLWDKSNGGSNGVLSRPFCLWDAGHIVPKQRKNPRTHVDEFGRCASYSRTTSRGEYHASREQYHEDELTVVCQVWNDFCKEHWPELYLNSLSEPDALLERHRQEQKRGDDPTIIRKKDEKEEAPRGSLPPPPPSSSSRSTSSSSASALSYGTS